MESSKTEYQIIVLPKDFKNHIVLDETVEKHCERNVIYTVSKDFSPVNESIRFRIRPKALDFINSKRFVKMFAVISNNRCIFFVGFDFFRFTLCRCFGKRYSKHYRKIVAYLIFMHYGELLRLKPGEFIIDSL